MAFDGMRGVFVVVVIVCLLMYQFDFFEMYSTMFHSSGPTEVKDGPTEVKYVLRDIDTFMKELQTTKCTAEDNAGPCGFSARVINCRRCICDWLASNRQLKCPSVLYMYGNENFGVMDPSAVINYKGLYENGCGTMEEDAEHMSRFLDQPNVIRMLVNGVPPVVHSKIELVPIGPSPQFLDALAIVRKSPNPPNATRPILYYVNHSPFKMRRTIFDTVNKNFGGTFAQ
jgi:hypothetical protein